MPQRLGLYDWSNKILADYENFHYEYLDDILNEIDNSKITKHFKWEWNGYYGFGYINLKNGIIDCDDIDCRDSYMTVDSKCKKHPNKHVTEIYNEKDLLLLFNKMLSENE